MVASHFTGPVITGDLQQGQVGGPNQGFTVLEQDFDIIQTGAGNNDIAFAIPAGSIIIDFIVDLLTAWNSATSALLSIGTSAGGTQYLGTQDVKTGPAGRLAVALTAAQLAAMAGLTTAGAAAPIAGPMFIRIAATGATTAGCLHLTVRYAQQMSSN